MSSPHFSSPRRIVTDLGVLSIAWNVKSPVSRLSCLPAKLKTRLFLPVRMSCTGLPSWLLKLGRLTFLMVPPRVVSVRSMSPLDNCTSCACALRASKNSALLSAASCASFSALALACAIAFSCALALLMLSWRAASIYAALSSSLG